MQLQPGEILIARRSTGEIESIDWRDEIDELACWGGGMPDFVGALNPHTGSYRKLDAEFKASCRDAGWRCPSDDYALAGE